MDTLAMSAPKKIATYLNAFRNTGEFEILTGIHRYVRIKGTLSLGPHPLQVVFYQRQDLDAWTGDGVIGFFYDPETVAALHARGIRVLNLTEQLIPLPIPVVVSDNHQIGRLAALHLMERGYRQFGYIGVKGMLFSDQRCQGFFAGLREKGLKDGRMFNFDLVDRQVFPADWFKQLRATAGSSLGILAADDDIAVKTVIAAQEMGIRIPQDVAIVGVNDMDLICETAAVPLSSVAPAYVRIGFEAAQLLDELLQGEQVDSKVIRVPPLGLTPRMSTRFFAFDDPLVEQALIYMHANVSHPFNVADVVNHCGKSRRTLELRFTTAVGLSLHDEINRLRLDRAKQLLKDTDWSISRIAEQCGFTDSKRLNESFLRTVGTSPTAFRAS
jgi:LacI family transcriptional regulator